MKRIGAAAWAIRSAATNSGADTIDFDSAYTIFPTDTLPQVVDRTTVDATTAGGRVTLNGQGIITNGWDVAQGYYRLIPEVP